jgi:hypothetical protein
VGTNPKPQHDAFALLGYSVNSNVPPGVVFVTSQFSILDDFPPLHLIVTVLMESPNAVDTANTTNSHISREVFFIRILLV